MKYIDLPVYRTDAENKVDFARQLVRGGLENVMTTFEYSSEDAADNLVAGVEAMQELVDSVNARDAGPAEAMLASQAVALNAVFSDLARRACKKFDGNLPDAERLLRLALKAQSQCRATFESIAVIQNPGPVFAHQANIAHGAQQVNNMSSAFPTDLASQRARKKKKKVGGVELITHEEGNNVVEQMDTGAARRAGKGNSDLVAVDSVDRPANARGQGDVVS
ncbi:hypothetical protein [Variovorax sp. dw_308]|uniref:hypothetical protein n=1 Tax=Variovorax sp. dw_308 TaxID=2721546 RepID=UPI001C45C584|nr:hypothetical protein [Variovorax sp. dw_308]